MKIIKEEVQEEFPNKYPTDASAIYIPTWYLIKKLQKYMFVQDHIRTIMYGYSNAKDMSQVSISDLIFLQLTNFEENEAFNKLVETLADEVLGGPDFNNIVDSSEISTNYGKKLNVPNCKNEVS